MAESLANNLQNLSSQIKLGNVFKATKQFMDSHDEELKVDIDVVLKHYQCTNDLDKLIRIRLINRYRCYDEVLNLLKSEDLFYISQALQCSWFYETSDFNPQLLVDCVLPLMSYTTRFKVLKRYSKSLKNPEIAVIFFNCLKQRYGLNTAFVLLPACDEIFVQNILLTCSMQIHISVLLSMFQANPSAVINYLYHILENASAKKRIYRKFNFSRYEKLFVLLATREPQKFSMLMEKYHRLIPYMKLGKRSTKQFVKTSFDSIKNNGLVYKRILNWKFVVPCLSLEQISELQFYFFPKTVNDFFQNYCQYSDFVLVVSSLKESVRKEILISNFNRAYNKPITAYLNVINLNSVHLLPEEIKEKWVESKLPTYDNPNDKARYIVHLPITKSLPMLKKLVQIQTDVATRIMILNYMFKTVIASNNQELIKDICLYVLNRFRNDKDTIRQNLITELKRYKHLLELSEDCWEAIEEIINISILENEVSGIMNMNLVLEIILARIHSRLLRGLPVDSYFEKLFKLFPEYMTFDLCINTPYEKYCLKRFIDNLAEKKLSDPKMEDNTLSIEGILKRICQWNACHINDRIDFPEWLSDWITNCFKKEDFHYRQRSILKVIKKDKVSKYYFYSKIFPNFIDPHIVTYNLNQDPELFLRHTQNILKKVLNDTIKPYHLFFKQCRLYPALKISDLISNYCIETLTQKYETAEQSKIAERKNSIEVLSVSIDSNKFAELVKHFYPMNSVINDFSDEGRELFQLQTEFIRCLKYVVTPSEVLDALLKFAVGDYLKLVVGSLSSVCLHTPENKILELLKGWLDCPISARKHFLRALFKIAPIVSTMESIVAIFENEKNISLRVLLFDHGFRLFEKEPSSETFMVLKSVARKLKSSDDTSINKLFELENVPDEFVSEYIQLLWDVINHNIENEVLLKGSRSKIIALIEPNILQLLSEEFCDVLIKEAFLQKSVDLFVDDYLLYSKNSDQLNSRYEKVFAEINQMLIKWNDFDLKSDIVFKNRRIISSFVDNIVRKSFSLSESKSCAYQLLQKIKVSLMNSLQECDILEEILLLEISAFFLITPDNDDLMHQFMALIEQLVDKVVSSYGTALIDTISSTINKTLAWKFSKNTESSLDNYLISFSEKLFSSSSNYCFILGIKLLPTVITSDINKYKNLLAILCQKNDPMIRLYVSKLFKGLISRVVAE